MRWLHHRSKQSPVNASYQPKNKYSVEKILESLGKCCCFNLEENIYRFNFYDTVLKDIGNSINIDFSLKNRTLQDIKKILGNTKII